MVIPCLEWLPHHCMLGKWGPNNLSLTSQVFQSKETVSKELFQKNNVQKASCSPLPFSEVTCCARKQRKSADMDVEPAHLHFSTDTWRGSSICEGMVSSREMSSCPQQS